MTWAFLLTFDDVPVDSGHGGQVRDRDGDEIDGYDESRSFYAHAIVFVPID